MNLFLKNKIVALQNEPYFFFKRGSKGRGRLEGPDFHVITESPLIFRVFMNDVHQYLRRKRYPGWEALVGMGARVAERYIRMNVCLFLFICTK